MQFRYRNIKTLILGLSFLPQAGMAADDVPADSISGEHDLEMVVVTATRTPKPLKDVPVLTRVITARDIERTDATSVQDLLQQEIPGIEFTYSMNQQTSLRMSGFGGSSILFLVDGERMAGETLDNVDYSRLNLDNVERVEIVKGAASTLYGSQAVGGVVNIITRVKDEPWTLNLNTRYGSHNEWRHGGTFSLQQGKWNSLTNVQRTSVDAVNLSESDAITQVYAHETWNVKERLIWQPVEDLKLTGRLGYFYRQRKPGGDVNDRYYDYTAGLKGDWTITEDDALQVSYAFDQYDKSDYSRLSRLNIRDYSNVQHVTRFLYNHTFAGRHTLTVGGDYMRDYLMSYQFEDNGSKTQHTADAFAQFDYNPTDRWNLLCGVRYDWFSRSGDSDVTAKLAAMYKWTRSSLRLSYSGGFRAPTLKEMYMSFNMANVFMIYGNEDLKSERSHNFSLTGEHGGDFGEAGKWNLTASGYYNLVDNRMATAWNAALNGMKYVNMDKVRVSGLDVNATATFDCGLAANVAYNYTHEHVPYGQPELSSQRPHSLTARFCYDHRFTDNYAFSWTLSGRWLSAAHVDEYTSMTDYTSTERVRYPGYTIWKLTLSQRIWRGITLNAAVDNLFGYRPDTYYNNSPATDGTTFTVGLSLDVEKIFK